MDCLHAARRPHRSGEVVTLLALIVITSGVRCGGDSPTAPSSSTAIWSLALVPHTDQLAVGAVVDLTLEATLRDGSTAIMSPLWGTDNPGVLLVKPLSTSRTGAEPTDKPEVVDHYLRGQVTASGPGVATVYADCAHGRGRQVIRVVAR